MHILLGILVGFQPHCGSKNGEKTSICIYILISSNVDGHTQSLTSTKSKQNWQGTLAELPLRCTTIHRQSLQQSALPWYALRSRVCKRTFFEPSCYSYKETLTSCRLSYIKPARNAISLNLNTISDTAVQQVESIATVWIQNADLGLQVSRSRTELSTQSWCSMSHHHSESSARFRRMTLTPSSFLAADRSCQFANCNFAATDFVSDLQEQWVLMEPKVPNIVEKKQSELRNAIVFLKPGINLFLSYYTITCASAIVITNGAVVSSLGTLAPF